MEQITTLTALLTKAFLIMGRLTSATDDQKRAAKDMIQTMMNANVKPENMSYTLGWDVVASYSEKQINQLLADRHKKDDSKMLQDLAIDVESYDPVTDKTYNAHYKLKFGPPLLHSMPARLESQCARCACRFSLAQNSREMV